jgi:uncharacterized tellurite resistance protein B-like protein
LLGAIRDFFQRSIDTAGSGEHDLHRLHLATAALLFEVLQADSQEHPGEREILEQALRKTFALSLEETRQLTDLARQEAEESVSLFQFTSLINGHFSLDEKIQVVEMLWQVAYADGELDPYEEAMVRKVAELIHVPHRHFIQAKHRVMNTHR